MKKLLIIGASILQVPAIKKAKEMGLYVGVVDFNPEAIGIPLADEYFNVSTIDEEGVFEAAKKFGADGIMTLATDMPMRSVAYACKKLGLVGISYDTAVKATDKGEMIRAFREHGVLHPWFEVFSSDDLNNEEKIKKITYPCITKPTDNSGSRGVMLVNSEKELKEALSYSSSNGRGGAVIVEEYMRGPEVSVEIMVIDGVVNVLQITDKLTTGAPHFVEMGHSQPSGLDEATQEKIKEVAISAVVSIGIDNGPAHAELIVTKDGPKMVEIGARMGGDCITTHLVPLSTGIDMVKSTIEIALGEETDITPVFNLGSAIKYIDAPKGTIKAIEGIEKARETEGVKEVSIVKSIGDTVCDIGSSTDRVGFLIAQADTAEKAVKICRKAFEKVKIKID